MEWVYDDGGRAAAGFTGEARDCVVRAIAIATGVPYMDVYLALREKISELETPARRGGMSSPRNGVHKDTIRKYLTGLGWRWIPTMGIGTGCKVHLRPEELPAGRLIASVSKHCVAVVDGVIRDTHDPSREGTRCVYGYYVPAVQVTNTGDRTTVTGARLVCKNGEVTK